MSIQRELRHVKLDITQIPQTSFFIYYLVTTRMFFLATYVIVREYMDLDTLCITGIFPITEASKSTPLRSICGVINNEIVNIYSNFCERTY